MRGGRGKKEESREGKRKPEEFISPVKSYFRRKAPGTAMQRRSRACCSWSGCTYTGWTNSLEQLFGCSRCSACAMCYCNRPSVSRVPLPSSPRVDVVSTTRVYLCATPWWNFILSLSTCFSAPIVPGMCLSEKSYPVLSSKNLFNAKVSETIKIQRWCLLKVINIEMNFLLWFIYMIWYERRIL